MSTRLPYFEGADLPPHLRPISSSLEAVLEVVFARSDVEVDEDELEAGVRKLLEARDCFMRSHRKPPPDTG